MKSPFGAAATDVEIYSSTTCTAHIPKHLIFSRSLSLSLSDPAVNSTVSCSRPWAATHTRINAATLRLSVFGLGGLEAWGEGRKRG